MKSCAEFKSTVKIPFRPVNKTSYLSGYAIQAPKVQEVYTIKHNQVHAKKAVSDRLQQMTTTVR